MIMEEKILTDKQEKYCQAYVVCANQSTAYRMAYDAESMNSNTIAVKACELHSKGNITVRIRELQQEAYERNKITIDELIQSMAGMVRFDIAELYTEHGALKNIHDIPKEVRQMIGEYTADEMKIGEMVIGHTKKVKVIDKLAAIEKLMKHLGGYREDNEQRQPQSSVIQVEIVNPKDDD